MRERWAPLTSDALGIPFIYVLLIGTGGSFVINLALSRAVLPFLHWFLFTCVQGILSGGAVWLLNSGFLAARDRLTARYGLSSLSQRKAMAARLQSFQARFLELRISCHDCLRVLPC